MNPIEIRIPDDEIRFFEKKAAEKVDSEGWAKDGRNAEVKTRNFVNCWVTEEAFKKLLMSRGVWLRNRGLYVGDASGAGVDFVVKLYGVEKSIGIRSTTEEAIGRYKEIAYPEDRFKYEKEKIADYIVACTNTDGLVRIYGIMEKHAFIDLLEKSSVKFSKNNQEHFRVVSILFFSVDALNSLMEQLEKV